MKIYCVCKHCLQTSSEENTIEINFFSGILYFVCPNCKKENKIEFEKKITPLPKITSMRRK